jgi:hypothetical protein
MALMIVLMIMMLLSAIMIGFMANIMADTRSSGVDRDETQAYAVAHAGMEKLTSDLAALFGSDYSPSGAQISAVAATTKQPAMPGFTYTDPDGSTGYKVSYTAKIGGVNTPVSTPTTHVPVPDDPTTGTTIAAGPYQGFKGLVTHYNITVTARSSGGSEVRMRRELQTVAVPVFQFGIFSEGPLAFHSGSDFNFGGRVHTNGDLYIAGGNGSPAGQLWLGDKVTAVGEVVRRYLDNGVLSTSLYPGPVNMAKGTGVYRVLSATANSNKGEGSVTGDSGPSQVLNEPTWTNLSIGTYNGYIRNGRTGAKRLDLPLVTSGAEPIDLIRRPPVNEHTAKPLVYGQRYYSQASLRVLLSDVDGDITALPQSVTGTPPISLENAAQHGPVGRKTPLATSPGGGNYRSAANTPLVGGVIKIEMQRADGTWADVTQEILDLGISGRNISNGTPDVPFTGANGGSAAGTKRTVLNACLDDEIQPNAIIKLQRVKDVPSTDTDPSMRYGCATNTITNAPSLVSSDYWPLSLFDAREGFRRDESGKNAAGAIRLGGVMYYVELDVTNLARWFRGTIGASGTQAKNDNNGFIVYFSDRRNNRNSSVATKDPRFADGAETGEYGYEDIINKDSSTGADDSALDDPCSATTKPEDNPEDVNRNCHLETYGQVPSYIGYNAVPPGAAAPLNLAARPNDSAGVTTQIIRGNRPIFFRRALKLVNGAGLPGVSGMNGLTIASENPVYVQGNYNTTATDTTGAAAHIAASIIADAITLLSNSWNDIKSFEPDPVNIANRTPTTTGYRFAAVTGKNISFRQPTGWSPQTIHHRDQLPRLDCQLLLLAAGDRHVQVL